MKFGVNNKNGVSNVVASIMVLGIMSSLMGMVFTTYVPAMAESIQYEHQTTITEDFIVFKNTVDTLVVRNDLEVSMVTTMTLGNKGGPIMSVGHNSGSLSFYPEETVSEVYDIDPPVGTYCRGRGTVHFETQYDRIADKILHFEHDAIIVDQEGNSVMKVEPNIYLSKASSNIVFSYTAMTFVGDAISLSGTKVVTMTSTLISTQRTSFYQTVNNDVDDVELNLTTSFPELWEMYFTDLCEDGELDPADFYVKSGPGWAALEVYDVFKLSTTSAVVEINVKE